MAAQWAADAASRLAREPGVVEVWVFGSAAKGYATPDSDLDLLVVLEGPIDLVRDYNRLRGSIRDIPCPVELVLKTREQFELRREWVGYVEREASLHGVRFDGTPVGNSSVQV
jgi:predicted nucleotidyltransferase